MEKVEVKIYDAVIDGNEVFKFTVDVPTADHAEWIARAVCEKADRDGLHPDKQFVFEGAKKMQAE